MAVSTLSSPARPAVERRAVMPRGFRAGGTTAGIKASGRPDLGLIVALERASAAAVFTPNAFAAAPVKLSRANLAATSGDPRGGFGYASAIVSTSGCANAATGAAGDADQAQVGAYVSTDLGIDQASVLHLSTGIIGTRLPLDRVASGIASLATQLAADDAALQAVAEALRTTDSIAKVATTSLVLPDAAGEPVTVTITGIAKGVGMIHPNMATMLSVVLTDAAAPPDVLWSLLRPAAARTWDQLSVDGDTSTNDTVFVLASGASGAAPLTPDSPAALAFETVARDLARQQAADGEGATILITASVTGAADDADARAVARAVVSSSLVKAAAHGKDPNWGRIAGAAGNAVTGSLAVLEAAGLSADDAARRASQAAVLDPDRLRISIAGYLVFDGSQGGPLQFDREAARAAMDAPELLIELDLGLGDGVGEAFGCDLTEEYVIENSEYTT